MILERLVLKVGLTPAKILNLVILLSGVTLVSHPQFLFGTIDDPTASKFEHYHYGVIFALSSALFSAISYVSISTIKSEVNSTVLVWYVGLAQLLLCFGLTFFDENSRLFNAQILDISPYTWLAMLSIAFLGILGFTTITIACKLVDPTMVSFVRSLEIVFAMIAGIPLFGEFPSILSVIGSFLVLVSVTTKAVEKPLENLWASKNIRDRREKMASKNSCTHG